MGSIVCGSKDGNFVIGPSPAETPDDTSELSDILFMESNKDIEELTIIELTVKCTNLFAENRFQLLSPVAFISVEENGEFVKKIETEILSSTLNPIFRKQIRAVYSLQKNHQVKFEIFDSAAKKANRVLIGSNIFSLHEISSRNDFVTKDLMAQGKRNGMISVGAKELKYLGSMVTMQWEFVSSKFTKGFMYLRILRSYGDTVLPVYNTETRRAPYSKI
jgi:hypothetical protein